MTKSKIVTLLWLFPIILYAQNDYFGAGNDDDIIITTSDDHTYVGWSESASGDNTINGSGLDAPYHSAARFLSQAALGADEEMINYVKDIGFEAWLDEQFDVPYTDFLDDYYDIVDEGFEWHLMNGGDSSEFYARNWVSFNYAWWTKHMTHEDVLRQRIAFALSEILVISINTDLAEYGEGLADYYDILYKGAFGNYRDVLFNVTMHPCMGFYLSHLNNPKAIPEDNIHPDENYAREIMQLFTIGLYELNIDGSRKLDNNGDPIPTYGQKEITEFAKVFTGLGPGAIHENMWVDSAMFDIGIYLTEKTVPMKMYDDWHQEGQKELLNGYVIPAGQNGMEDINDAIDHLMAHPNVGPFISKLLIQRLVKSNPSPAYVARVAQAFNDNGQGVKGDLQAVIKAILLDDEARSCEWSQMEESGKMREPLIRWTQTAKALPTEHFYGRYWNIGYDFWDINGQIALGSPTVFNFFLPDHQPVGEISDLDLFAPEFQLHNTKSSIGYINYVNNWAVYNNAMWSWAINDPIVGFNLDKFKAYAHDPEVLINKLDILFTNGQLSDNTRQIILDALNPLVGRDFRENRVELGIYLILMSPDYVIQR